VIAASASPGQLDPVKQVADPTFIMTITRAHRCLLSAQGNQA
jgi:hypothetical protein